VEALGAIFKRSAAVLACKPGLAFNLH